MRFLKALPAFVLLIQNIAFAEILSIPLEYTSSPAKDLVNENGEVLTTTEVRSLWQKNKDLSFLNPEESDIWKNSIGKKILKSDDELGIKTDEPLSYVDSVVSTVGVFRFLVRESNLPLKRNFNIWLSKDNRSILLRKNLLRKMGYTVPKIQNLRQLKIEFNGLATLNSFLATIESSTFADKKRWVKNIDEEKFIVELQDVLIYEENSPIYNFAIGEFADGTIAHRRALNAMSLLYAIVDLRESVDGFSWDLGRTDNKVVLFDIQAGEYFSTTYFDALWMLKRIAKLTREDLFEVVQYANLPPSVSMLLLEKILSRINSILKIFKIRNENLFDIEYDINDQNGELVKGRLTKDSWEGHASRYSYDDTKSPLSKDEMVSYFQSKFYSGLIENLVSTINEKVLFETDIQEKAIEHAIEAQQKQLENLFKTGQYKEVPFSTWTVPTLKGNISASRNIITGSYLGTDNAIQIADSLEFIGEAGIFVGTLGLPVDVLAYASGNARFSRSYTHVKSIKSIKKALKEPFRNIIVPRVKKLKAQNIIQMIDQLKQEDFQALDGQERITALENILNQLNKVMEIGDSLIIANNLVFGGSIVGGYKVPINTTDLSLSMQLSGRKVNIWRFHIVRSGEREFQFYKSSVGALGGGMGFSLKAYIPILNLGWDKQSGNINTRFQSLNFTNLDDTETTMSKLTQLRQVLVENSAELLDKYNPPFIIDHDFSEFSGNRKLLTDQSMQVKLSDRMKVTHPKKYKMEFQIRNHSTLVGKNYMQVAYDALNGLIEKFAENSNLGFSNTESGNPGDSFYGESFARQTLTEVPIIEEDSEIPFENFSQVKSRWKGWSADREKLISIKGEIDKKYGKGVFNDELFYDTDLIKLYSIDITLNIYAKGLGNLLSIPESEFTDLIEKNIEIPWPKGRPKIIWTDLGHRVHLYRRKSMKILNQIKNAHRRLSSDYKLLLNPEQVASDLSRLVSTLELFLPFKLFSKMLGGDDYYYLKGSVNGFRVGVEDGEKSIISNGIGEFGSEFTGGVLDTLRNAIKISQGELGAYWYLRRLQ